MKNEYSKFTSVISKKEFESKLKKPFEIDNYIDVYFDAHSFIKWKKFDYEIYLIENYSGEPILFIFQ